MIQTTWNCFLYPVLSTLILLNKHVLNENNTVDPENNFTNDSNMNGF